MDRRTFLATVAGGLLATPLAAEAEQAGKVWRIGVLVPVEPESPTEPNVAAFRQGLHDLGYVEGQNIAVEYRYAHGKAELYTELLAQLVRLRVDVMVVGSGIPTLAAKNATQEIPIVGVGMSGDPVGIGLVTSLARPGGNVTGVSTRTGEGFFGKHVQLLKEAVPRISRVGYLRDPRNPASVLLLKEVQTATLGFDLKFQDLAVRELDEIDGMLATLIVPGELLLMRDASRVTSLAAKHRLPAIYGLKVFYGRRGAHVLRSQPR
jgi:putative ABC transport system substrate-binding protein